MDVERVAAKGQPDKRIATGSSPRQRRGVVLLALLVLLALTRGALYVALTPPWQAPDEPQHYQMVRLLMELGRIPQRSDAQSAVVLHETVVASLSATGFWETRHHLPRPQLEGAYSATAVLNAEKMMAAVDHPPVYYALAALALWPFSASSILTQLYVLRLLSVLMSLVTIVAVYAVGRWLSPGRPARVWAAASLVVFLPMHSFATAALNNDALAEALAALVFVLLAALWVHGLSAAQLIGLPVLVLLALLTKRTDLFLVPLAVGTLLAYCWFRMRADGGVRPPDAGMERGARWLLLSLGLILVACVGVVLCDLVWRPWWGIAARLRELVGVAFYAGVAPKEAVGLLLLGFGGFWGNFGWLNVPLDVSWYAALAMLSLIALLGGLKGAYRLARAGARAGSTPRGIWLVCILALLAVTAQSVVSVLVRQIPLQGRYLFPALVPIALCFTWGAFEWVPQRFHRPFLVLWIAWWVTFDWIALFGYFLPYYYG